MYETAGPSTPLLIPFGDEKLRLGDNPWVTKAGPLLFWWFFDQSRVHWLRCAGEDDRTCICRIVPFPPVRVTRAASPLGSARSFVGSRSRATPLPQDDSTKAGPSLGLPSKLE